MTPEIKLIDEIKLVGKHMLMSFSNYTIGQLWQSFMQERKNISNISGIANYSLALYPPDFFTHFHPANSFERWAAVEVANFTTIPAGMEAITIPAGLYAVFHYKGMHNNSSIFQYIYQKWLPESGYNLDNRPHFEWLGDKYQNNNPESEEDIWIPIK